MLFPEEKKTYETKIGSTKFIVTSECLSNAQQDILDSLSRLMVRDCGDVYEPPKAREKLDEDAVNKNFKALGRTLINP